MDIRTKDSANAHADGVARCPGGFVRARRSSAQTKRPVARSGVSRPLTAPSVRVERAGDETAKSRDDSVPRDRDERDLALDAWFEPDGGAGGDVEPEAAGGLAVEVEAGVGLGEVEVGADLDGAVGAVGDDQGGDGCAGVELERAVADEDFAGMIGVVLMRSAGGS